MSESVDLRRRAVDLAAAGHKPTAIARELGRSREWVRIWLARHEAGGDEALLDRSRRPFTSPSRLLPHVIDEIVTVRHLLAGDRHANFGPVAVAAEIERRGLLEKVPSVSSIKRVISRQGLTRPYDKPPSTKGSSSLGLPAIESAGISQQADWVHDRFLEGGTRFSSLQISDVGSHMLSTGQYHSRKLLVAVQHLTQKAWPNLSIPYAMGFDNAFSKTTHRNNPWTIWIRILLAFGVEAIISPPNTLGFTNHIEAVNALWQERTIKRHHYNNLEELNEDSSLFQDWANTRRAILDPAQHGTRYPAEHVTANTTNLRWLPDGFTIDNYLDNNGTPRIPLSRGRATFLRHITEEHTITIAHTHWPIPTTLPTGALVIAGIDTATGHLTIRHRGETITRYDYPTPPSNIDPYHPATTTGLLDHLPTMS